MIRIFIYEVRTGLVDRSGTTEFFVTLDDMTFSYTGNQQTSVTNSKEALAFEGMTGLGKSGTYAKTYDASGRLKKDASRGITNITYDNDGRPLKVSFSDMSEQEYEWDGMGNHLSTRFNGVSYTGKQYTKMVRKYTGDGRVVDNGVEKYALYPGGFMQDSTYYWYVRDYQGNNIAVMDGSKNLIQETNYYPYGEPWREPEGEPDI